MRTAKVVALAGLCTALTVLPALAQEPGANPLFPDVFTADPAPLVVDDRLYVYVGHDEARGDEMFTMKEWLVFSTTDLRRWTTHGPIMRATDFAWASRDAWAAQAIERNGRFYFYATVEHDATRPGKAIGVAVSDSPTGPFVDARGSALIANDMTPDGPHSWDDIDPTVIVDHEGVAWLIWGNGNCYFARLKPNMIELDGPIGEIALPDFEEGPWIHRRGDTYYLAYASRDHVTMGDERLSYATAPAVTGPWTHRGQLSGPAQNSFTIHPGIVDFRGEGYLFYHDGSLTIGDQTGGLGRRAVRAEHLYYESDGTLKPVEHTDAGLTAPRER
jgi:hypothetical protein